MTLQLYVLTNPLMLTSMWSPEYSVRSSAHTGITVVSHQGSFLRPSFQVEMVVRLWKDGFTVNDEEFRSYSIPNNQDFLDAIKRG